MLVVRFILTDWLLSVPWLRLVNRFRFFLSARLFFLTVEFGLTHSVRFSQPVSWTDSSSKPAQQYHLSFGCFAGRGFLLMRWADCRERKN